MAGQKVNHMSLTAMQTKKKVMSLFTAQKLMLQKSSTVVKDQLLIMSFLAIMEFNSRLTEKHSVVFTALFGA